jgi:CRISPR-associated exonuclease Cas4
MTTDSEAVLISALEHWSYCARQCGLIHLECTFEENEFTVRGSNAHQRAHGGEHDTAGDVRVVRGIPLWSDMLGLVGKADAVEFRGLCPYPIEYKVGRRRKWGHEDIQVAAQAMCLEEMTGRDVPEGAIYYVASRRRRAVTVDSALRSLVVETTRAIRIMLSDASLAPPVNDARCKHCSLADACLPDVVARPQRIHHYASDLWRVRLDEGSPQQGGDPWSS